jgi:peptidoglycan hydrolase-like protein with peptidoglycan-binding domain
MRNALRRITFGMFGAGMVVAMAASMAPAAGAAVAARQNAAAAAQPATHRVWPTVQRGDTGPRVASIQYLLNVRIGSHLAATGFFGPRTEADTKTFQRRNGLTANGIVRSATWEKLIVTVQRGNVSQAVTAVQVQLRYSYGYIIVVDGIFGPKTESAVKAFQRRFGLRADGIVGRSTWHKMIVHDM